MLLAIYRKHVVYVYISQRKLYIINIVIANKCMLFNLELKTTNSA